MNAVFKFLLLPLLLGSAGCIPLREIAHVEGPRRPDILLYDRCMLARFDLIRERIDTQSSYIESPGGKRYTLEVKPHQFDLDRQRDYVGALLYPIAPDGSPLQRWRSGVWSFHFVVETNGMAQIIDQKWKFYHWLYCPLIHGAPN